ncbi:MAG: transporter permease [Devosia sp.]|nr:transporter permease [Devosia sp.]
MTTETVQVPVRTPQQRQAATIEALLTNLRDYGLILALIAIMIFFQFATNGVLFKPVNLTNVILQNSYIIIMALGMLLVIIAGHIDLSVGSVAGFIGALAAMLMVGWNLDDTQWAFLSNPLVAAFICVVVGGFIGAAQGYWIAYHRIPSFIVTLAGMLVFRGLTLTILGGKSIGPFPPEFQGLSAGYITDYLATWLGMAPYKLPLALGGTPLHLTTFVVGLIAVVAFVLVTIRTRRNREARGYESEPFPIFAIKSAIIAALVLFFVYTMSSYKGLPNVLIVMSILIALFVFITKRTTIGRRVYAMGGNEKAAKLSGIKTDRLTFLIFINMGILSALAGLIFAARLGTATPKAGTGFELDVIAAVFIGGASAMGGVGQVAGSVIGAFIIGVMNNGMSIMGISIDWQQVIKGLVLLAAVVFDVYNKNKG